MASSEIRERAASRVERRPNGDVVLCCVDWERTTVFGNIHEQSLREIWNSEKYRAYRRRMKERDLAGTLCEHCQGT